MKKYVWVALGGIAGTLPRYYIKNAHLLGLSDIINTLFINIAGSFLLGRGFNICLS